MIAGWLAITYVGNNTQQSLTIPIEENSLYIYIYIIFIASKCIYVYTLIMYNTIIMYIYAYTFYISICSSIFILDPFINDGYIYIYRLYITFVSIKTSFFLPSLSRFSLYPATLFYFYSSFYTFFFFFLTFSCTREPGFSLCTAIVRMSETFHSAKIYLSTCLVDRFPTNFSTYVDRFGFQKQSN